MIYKLSLPLLFTALLIGGALTSCQRVEPVNNTDQPDDNQHLEQLDGDLTFRLVAEGNHGPVEPGEYVYRDADEWRAVEQGLRSPAYQPSLSMEGVLLASVHANTGGYSLRFDSVQVVDGQTIARYTVVQPGPECMVTQALTQPFQIIAVPDLPPGEVRFERRTETYSC